VINRIWLIAPALTALGALLGSYQASGEISASSYQALVEIWPRLSSEVRSDIGNAMDDGKVSRWEWIDLQRGVMASAGFLMFSAGEDTPERREGLKAQLISLVHNSGG